MKIIYYGSDEFSLPIVQQIKLTEELAAVVVVRDKPKGRGLKINPSPVASWARDAQISIFDPVNPNDSDFVQKVHSIRPDLFVLSAYGHILGRDLLAVPRLGAINIHPSLLPRYRGAAPIQRAIMADEKNTGLTVFFMDEKIDHGDIIFQTAVPIRDEDNYASLASRLSTLAAEAISGIINRIAQGAVDRIPQNDALKCPAPKIQKHETIINWQNDARSIFNLIRALFPTPGARTIFRGRELIIQEAAVAADSFSPGTFHIRNRFLYAGTSAGSLIIKRVKPENRAGMTGLDFINGFRVIEGEIIQ